MHPPLRHRILGARALLALALLFLFVAGAAAGAARGVYAQESSAASNSMTFAAVFTRASYGNLETSYNTPAVESADLDLLLATGVPCIRIDIGYAPWLQNNQTAINEITSLVQQIKAAGKCLIIADAASETYRKGGQLPWSQFMAAWIARVSTLATLYQPNYYIVVKEPGWYVPMISDATTNPQFQNVSVWLSLTQNLTDAVHAASPSTTVGVAIAANSLTTAQGAFYSQYLNQVQGVPGISFIGFDIYGPGDQKATQTYLSQYPASEPVWIPEAWSTANGAPLDGSASADAQWIQSMYSFATSIHASFLIPFYTDDFASYNLVTSPPTSPSQIISLYAQRTPVFSAFQSLVESITGGSSSSSSSSASGVVSNVSTSSTESTGGSKSTTATSSVTHTSTPTGKKSSSGLFSPAAVALELIVLLVLIGAIVYYRRRV